MPLLNWWEKENNLGFFTILIQFDKFFGKITQVMNTTAIENNSYFKIHVSFKLINIVQKSTQNFMKIQ